MTKEEVFETVKNVVVEELDVDEDQVTLDAKIKDDLEADSLDVFEIMNELEDKLKKGSKRSATWLTLLRSNWTKRTPNANRGSF